MEAHKKPNAQQPFGEIGGLVELTFFIISSFRQKILCFKVPNLAKRQDVIGYFKKPQRIMTDLKKEYKVKLLNAILVQNRLIDNSKYFDNITKEAFLNLGNYWIERIGKESFTLTQLKSITSDILTFWKESIGIDTELFWIELKKNNIDFERKDEINFALAKGRFRRVDIGIGARKDWAVIKDFDSIKQRFLIDEIEKISLIIEKDEKIRTEILKKCLRKKEIPQTQYLKFGECWAYMSNCKLWDKYFSKEEVEELDNIHRNFKSK
ncbi:hypothetical protein [Flavobacterium sp. GP15]|uniref:hypothetical protein n=1 Tax=Flavobacterium sp. GP15 TaxID=2758567 RepID=UPI00165E615F|nr:hypothetical protein [Flavobacterium sp. GP15]